MKKTKKMRMGGAVGRGMGMGASAPVGRGMGVNRPSNMSTIQPRAMPAAAGGRGAMPAPGGRAAMPAASRGRPTRFKRGGSTSGKSGK